jgi:phosphoserine aminotransferase
MPEDIIDSFPKDVPIVCDASSNFCSRKIDISRYACVFAGAQKVLFIYKRMSDLVVWL